MISLAKDVIKRIASSRIRGGPFKGMRYRPTAFCSGLWPKLLGTYEKEIGHWVDILLLREGLTVIDVGAAEGYYAVGILFRNPTARVIAFETDPGARTLLAQLAAHNQVSNRLTVQGTCDVESLQTTLAQQPGTVVFMDIEGGEYELLDPERIPGLKSIEIIVELHEYQPTGRNESLKARFSTTHDVSEVTTRHPSTDDIPVHWLRSLASWLPGLAQRLLHERDSRIRWYHMCPRQPN